LIRIKSSEPKKKEKNDLIDIVYVGKIVIESSSINTDEFSEMLSLEFYFASVSSKSTYRMLTTE